MIGKAIELGWAGLRIDFHEDRNTSLKTLLRDWLGENQSNSSTGFADALRNTPAGYYFFDVVGTKFFETVGATESPSDFHRKFANAESSRSPFISAFVSQNGGQQIFGAKVTSPTNQSAGFGTNAGERFGDLRSAASLNLLQTDPHDLTNTTKGNLLVVSKPTTSGNWSLEINGWAEGFADISILTPTSGKNYRQIVFGNVPLTAGKRYRISFRALGSASPIVEEYIGGTFQPVNLLQITTDLLDPNPEITGVIQVTDDVIEGGDNYGRLVGILFSKPMVKTSVESVSRYQIGGGELVADPSQIIGRLITTTGAYQNFGERFSIISLDSPVGPFIKRTLTANGMVDKSGKIISGATRDINTRVSPQGNPPGGYMTGRVMQADGTPVPNAGVYYRRMKPGFIGGMPTPPCGLFSDWETVSFQRADSNGEFTIDYVREGDCHPVTVLFQNQATNSQKNLVSNVAYNGQHLIFNAVFLARGNVQGTVTSGGVPLANAYVSILSELDPLNNKLVRTDAQGFYSAEGVPVGGLTVKAVGSGTYSLSSGIAAGNLSEPDATVTIDVSTQNVSGVIKGKVLDSGSGGGQSPVPNSLVIARANIPGFPGASGAIPVGYAFTGQDGSFTIDRLPIGNVYLQATDPQMGIGTSATVQLTEQNPRVEGIILSVSNGFGKVAGRVLNEIGQTIPNAVIQEGSQAVQADLSGNYVLPQVREGNVSIRATDPVTHQSGSTTITVRRGEDTNGADIIIRRPAFLNGQVFITENGVTAPLPQAYVSAGRQIVRTDAQGHYQLSDVESGKQITVRFVDPQGKLFVNTNVFLNPGETLFRNANFKPGRIHGKITQPDGVTPVVTGVGFKTSKPHLGQNAFFGLPEESNLSYQTGTDGLYTFENLNPIDYRVSASNVFFPIPVSQTGNLPPTGDLEINLSLVDTLAGKVHGHIFKPDGTTPVGAGVKVSLGGGSLADVTVRTDATGYYEFAEVFAAGGYILTATDPLTNATNRIGVNINKNDEIEVDLRLLGRGNLKVKVIDGGGNPLQTGSIWVEGTGYPKDQRYIEISPVNNGEFEFTNLNEGGYAISAEYNGLGGRVSGTVTTGGITEATVQIQSVGSVAGRVFMPNGSTPVGLADVTLKQNGRIIGLITTQDSEEERGKFSFGYVPAGDFTIDVFDNRSGRSGRTAGTISEQGQINNVSVNLLALGTVTGQVTSNGVPAAHALIRISADGSGISGTSRVATTDSDGRYRFPGIPVGRVHISVANGPGGLTGHSEGIISGTNEPLPDTIIDVALTPTAVITGIVYKFGAAETFSGALVKITSGNFTGNTTTDETGRYRFDFVPLGNISVRVESPFGYDRGKSETIVSNEPSATITADVVMSGVGQIGGLATDSSGNPLTFGKVTFTNTVWGENITALAPVQPDGTYSLAGLPTGDFTLKLTVPEIVGVGTAADILPGGQSLIKNLQLEPAGRVFGNVLITNGTSPAIGSDVVLSLTKQGGGSYTFITHTNESGNWEINNLPLGAINIRIYDSNSDGFANITGLNLSLNGQEINTGAIVLDNVPPAIESVIPADESTDIPRTSVVLILFSEAMDAASINSSTVKLKKGNLSVSLILNVSSDGKTVTATPSQSLTPETLYALEITTAVRDRNGIALQDAFSSTFTTSIEIAPFVNFVSPENNTINVPRTSAVQILFSQQMNAATINSNTVKLKNLNSPISSNLNISGDGRTVTLIPIQPLTDTTAYTIEVTTGVRDINGVALQEPFTSSFVTADETPPVVNLMFPVNGAVHIPLDQNLIIVFDEALGENQQFADIIQVSRVTAPRGNVSGDFGISEDRKTVTFTPSELIPNTRYQLRVTGQTDIFGNVQNNVFTSFFTTIDNAPPILYDFYIDWQIAVDGLITDKLRPQFSINYQDNVGINTDATGLYLAKQGETPEAVQSRVSQTSLTYQPDQPLTAGQYVVKVTVMDLAGNQSSTPEITFTVNPQNPEINNVIPNYGVTSGNDVVTVKGRNLISQFNLPDASARGLSGEYYSRDDARYPLELKLVRTDSEINFDLVDEPFSPYITNKGNQTVFWRGKIIPRYSEDYTFTFELSGGVRIYIDDNPVVSSDAQRTIHQESGTISMEAGREYDIVIEHFPYYIYQGYPYGNFGTRHSAKLFWSSSSQAVEIVPREQLRPALQASAPIVRFGGLSATVIGAVSGSDDQIAVLTPPHAEGTVSVEIIKEDAIVTRPDAFTYFEDDQPPYVRIISPSDVSNIAPPSRINVIFNEPLATDQNFNDIVKVYDEFNNYAQIEGSVTIDETNRKLIFTPSQPFAENSRYTTVVSNQRDTAGNTNTAQREGRFSTTDQTAPNIYSTAPADQSSTYDQKPPISAYYQDDLTDINPDSAVMILDGVDVTAQAQKYNSSIRYQPLSPLSFGTHTATVRVADIAGNTAEKTFVFTIAPDTEPPSITGFRIDGREVVEGFQTRFRQPQFTVYFQDNGSISYQQQKLFFGVQGSQLSPVTATVYGSYPGWILYYMPPQVLEFGFYSARVELTDVSGNTTTRTVNFEILDLETIPPTVTGISPENNAEEVAGNTPVIVTFSEPLDPNQNFADSMTVRKNQDYQRVGGSYSLNAEGNVLTFTPDQPLASDTQFYVNLSGYRDLAGNPGNYFYSGFSTSDTIAPVLEPRLNFSEDSIELGNARIYSQTPEIFLNYWDNLSGVNVSSLTFTLDGVSLPVETQYQGSSYTPPAPLSLGIHTITAQISDNRGNTVQFSGSFEIIDDPGIPFAVEDDTVLLWHLDEFSCSETCATPDAGPYRIGMDYYSYGRPSSGRFEGGVENPVLSTTTGNNALNFGANSFSVEGWIKYGFDPENPTLEPQVIWSHGTNSQKGYVLSLLPNGDLQARVFDTAGIMWETVLSRSTFDVADGQWHSIAMVVERGTEEAQNQLKLYVDGEMRTGAQTPLDFGAVRNTNGFFKLGLDSSSVWKADEIRISNAARSSEQILKNFNKQQMELVVLRTLPAIIQQGAETEITLEGYNLENISVSLTATDGSPIAATAAVLSMNPNTAEIRVTAETYLPLGDVLMVLTSGSWTENVQLRVVNQLPFTAEPGTVLLWHLDEPAGFSVADSSPNGINGFSYSTIYQGRFGNARGNEITANSNSVLMSFGNNGFTIEAWFKGSNDGVIFAKGNISNNSEAFLLDLTNGQIRARLRDTVQTIWEAKTNPQQIRVTDNKWHYVSMVIRRDAQEAAENRLLIYIDGIERANVQAPASFGSLRNTTQPFKANSNLLMDEIRILDFARTPQQITVTWQGNAANFSRIAQKPQKPDTNPGLSKKAHTKPNLPNLSEREISFDKNSRKEEQSEQSPKSLMKQR